MAGKGKFNHSKALANRHDDGSGNGNANPALAFEIFEPLCKVCQSPHRAQIDKCLAMGWTQKSVIDHFNQVLGEVHFNKDGMSRHKKLHLSMHDAAVRKIIENRAKQFNLNVDEVSGTLMTKAAALDTVILRGLEALTRGDTLSEPRDVLAAIQILEKMESEWKETAIDEMLKEFRAFSDSVRDVVGEDKFAAIWAGFEARLGDRQPALEAPKAPDPNEVLGEVIDEEEED